MARLFKGLLAALGRPDPSAPAPGRAAERKPATARCAQCGNPISEAIRRCPGCGAVTGESVAVSAESIVERPAVATDLTELEIEVLIATVESEEPRIHAYCPDGDEGEIKAGRVRIAGEDALAAVRRLSAAGLVEQTDDASFTLTRQGRRAANQLRRRGLVAGPST